MKTDLNLRWAHMSEGTLSDVVAHLITFFSLQEWHVIRTR